MIQLVTVEQLHVCALGSRFCVKQPKQTGLNRFTTDKAHSALLLTYTCQDPNIYDHDHLFMGWGLTSNLVWAVTVDLCTEMFTSTHFLFLWTVSVLYHTCWLITKLRLGEGSWPSRQRLADQNWPGRLIWWVFGNICVCDSHTQVLSGKGN